MSSRNVCIVGPRGSGKTTYLGSLVYHQEHSIKNNKKSKYEVSPSGDQSIELKNKAQVLLAESGEFEPTKIGDNIRTVDDLPFYTFNITGKLNWRSPVEQFQITARDYPGEVFDSLVNNTLDSALQEGFIQDCFIDKKGCIMMLPGWEFGADRYYVQMLTRFINLLESEGQKDSYKMAIVMSKCERGEIWPGRHEPELDLFQVHLKDTTNYLRKTILPKNLNFFAMSTFGVRSRNNPRPNRRDFVGQKGEPRCVLYSADSGAWQPYNLIEPLYWLIKS